MDIESLFPFYVSEAEHAERLDRILATRFPDVSRSRWAKLLDEGVFSIESKTAKGSQRVDTGMQVCLDPAKISTLSTFLEVAPALEERDPKKLRYSGEVPVILFEDEDLLVIDKPAGVAVHAGAGVPIEETLVAWLIQEKKVISETEGDLLKWGNEVLEEERPGIVHRLDKGTSGCLVIAKHLEAHRKLSEQFAAKTAGRLYWAWVQGDVEKLKITRPLRLVKLLEEHSLRFAFRIDHLGKHSLSTPVGRDPKNRLRFAVISDETGKQATTHFWILGKGKDWTWLDVKLETGRTHQIRVHLSFLGTPIIGDTLYGGRRHERILLHAHTLYFIHPRTEQKLEIKSRRAPLLSAADDATP
ncbi:MAG: RluA family pseudouridine synthase [Bdellovibrionota bacterium]